MVKNSATPRKKGENSSSPKEAGSKIEWWFLLILLGGAAFISFHQLGGAGFPSLLVGLLSLTCFLFLLKFFLNVTTTPKRRWEESSTTQKEGGESNATQEGNAAPLLTFDI